MTVYLLRRRKLGMSSVKGISHFSKTGIKWYNNYDPEPEDITGIIRWGCTSNVPEGVKVWNPAKGIHRVADKSGFRMLCQETGEDIVPTTFTNFEEALHHLQWEIEKGLVVRPRTHAQGRNIWLATTPEELRVAVHKAGPGWYASEFIDKDSEYRYYICQGRVVSVAKKTPDDPKALAWNVARGGRFDVCRWDDWPLEGARVAVEAFKLSKLDFGGVDVMMEGPKAYVIEMNSAPSLPMLKTTKDFSYRQKCMAKGFDWMVQGKEVDPIINYDGWRSVIHPAIWNKAKKYD